MSSVYMILTVLACVLPCALACSVAPGTKIPTPHTMEETLYAADIVVCASIEDITRHNLYDVQHDIIIKCVFKDVNDQLPHSLNVTLDYEQLNSCSGHWPNENGDYIMGLKAVTGGKFVLDEPEGYGLESATFEANDENLEGLLKLCGMQDPQGEMCPQHDDEDTNNTDEDTDGDTTDDENSNDEEKETCIKAEYSGSAAHTYTSLLTIITTIIVYASA